MKSDKLTSKQESILIFIKKHIAKNGYPPTVREIAAAVNLSSPATVHVHLGNLIEKGYIQRNKKNKRILELLVPNEFEQMINDEISVTLFQNNKKNSTFKILKSSVNKYNGLIAFKMDNNLFRTRGILKNDILLFDTEGSVNNNDMVLINIDDTFFVREILSDTIPNKIIGKLIKLYREY